MPTTPLFFNLQRKPRIRKSSPLQICLEHDASGTSALQQHKHSLYLHRHDIREGPLPVVPHSHVIEFSDYMRIIV